MKKIIIILVALVSITGCSKFTQKDLIGNWYDENGFLYYTFEEEKAYIYDDLGQPYESNYELKMNTIYYENNNQSFYQEIDFKEDKLYLSYVNKKVTSSSKYYTKKN